jgi:hypothetical protein
MIHCTIFQFKKLVDSFFRYLDIGLGLVLFSSTLSLVYAGYSESKAWLVVFTSGSLAVLVLYWSWAAYNKYVSSDYLEYSQEVSISRTNCL